MEESQLSRCLFLADGAGRCADGEDGAGLQRFRLTLQGAHTD